MTIWPCVRSRPIRPPPGTGNRLDQAAVFPRGTAAASCLHAGAFRSPSTAQERPRPLDRRSGTSDTQVLPAAQQTGVSVERTSYHGWPGCYLISNGSVEAAIVPAIGRVMQLRLAG